MKNRILTMFGTLFVLFGIAIALMSKGEATVCGSLIGLGALLILANEASLGSIRKSKRQ